MVDKEKKKKIEQFFEYLKLSKEGNGLTYDQRQHYKNLADDLEKECFTETELRDRIKRYQMNKRIIEKVSNMQNPLFITFTWDNEKIDLQHINRKLRDYFKNNRVYKYCLITDIGKNGVIHYHGFIDLEYCSNALENVSVKKLGTCKTLKYFYERGFYNVIRKLQINDDDIKRSVKYCTKYCCKAVDGFKEFKHKMLSSRIRECNQPQKPLDWYLERVNNDYSFNFEDTEECKEILNKEEEEMTETEKFLKLMFED